MSDDRLEARCQEGIDAFNRGDAAPALALFADDVECVRRPGPHEHGHVHRPRRLPGDDRRLGRGVGDGQGRGRRRRGARRTITCSSRSISARVGAGSGVPVEMTIYWLFRVRRREDHALPHVRRPRQRRSKRRRELESAPMAVKTEAIGKTYDAGHLQGRPREDRASTRTRSARTTRSTTTATRPRPPAFATSSRRRCSASSTRRAAMGPAVLDPEVGINFATMVHGGQEFVWGEPVCAGDEITTVGEGDRDLRAGRQGLLRLRVRLDATRTATRSSAGPGPTSSGASEMSDGRRSRPARRSPSCG